MSADNSRVSFYISARDGLKSPEAVTRDVEVKQI